MKKSLKLGRKETGLLMGLLGVVIAALTWVLYASPTIEKTERLERENNELRGKVEEYQAVHARLPEYQEGIIAFINDSEEVINHYPSYLENKDLFMFWANLSSSHPNTLQIGDFAIEGYEIIGGGSTSVSVEIQYDEAGNPITDGSATAVPGTNYELYRVPMNMGYKSTYAGLKQLLEYITTQNDKNSIESLSIGYDDNTGELNGQIRVAKYFIKGLDKAYSPEFIPSVPTGVRDIFGTGADVLGVLQTNTNNNEEAADEETAE